MVHPIRSAVLSLAIAAFAVGAGVAHAEDTKMTKPSSSMKSDGMAVKNSDSMHKGSMEKDTMGKGSMKSDAMSSDSMGKKSQDTMAPKKN